jgi:transposase
MKDGKFTLHHTKQKKGKNIYVYHSLAWYYRKNGKPYRNTLINFGKLTVEEVEYYKDAVACLNHEPGMLPCNINNIEVTNCLEYLPCAIGIHFWNFWRLFDVFPNDIANKDVSTHDIALILTILRLVRTCSKNSTVELYESTAAPQLIGVSLQSYNKSRIFRELEPIENYREELGKHIYNYAQENGYTKGKLVFYDLSSANFSGLRCLMAKWGHCKDGYLVHVVLLLVITPEGYPIYWEIVEGNTADAKTLADLIQNVEKIHGPLDSVICFDRGIVSDENLKILEGKGIEFITALDGNQLDYFETEIDFDIFIKVKQLDHEHDFKRITEILLTHGFLYERSDLYYKEIILSESEITEIERKTNKLALRKRRYFLAFNPILAYLTDKHRKERVEEFKLWLEEYNKDLNNALRERNKKTIAENITKQIRKRKLANVKINYNLEAYEVINKDVKGRVRRARTYKINLDEIKPDSFEQAQKYDGLWMLITNISKQREKYFFQTSNFTSYLEIYRLKNAIEESFKILSSFVGFEPIYVYKEQHVKAHFTICILSYLIEITILNKIRSSKKVDNMSLETIFNQLAKCKQHIIKLKEGKFISRITTVDKKLEKVLKELDCSYLVAPSFLTRKGIVTLQEKCA